MKIKYVLDFERIDRKMLSTEKESKNDVERIREENFFSF